MRLKFTKTAIDRQCVPPRKGEVNGKGKPIRQMAYWDTSRESPRGFGLIVSTTCSTFVLQRQVRGRTVRTTVGRYGDLTLEQARERARDVAAQMDGGVDPNRRPDDAPDWETFTVRDAMERHVRDMEKKNRSPRSTGTIRDEMTRLLADWLDRPIAEIRRHHCVERHEKVTTENGPAVANRVLRQFRACWNTAAIHLEVDDQHANPVGKKFPWNEERSRHPISWRDLPVWAARVNAIANPVRRDLQWFILLTGLRSEDARTVRWEDVDFDAGTLHRPRPKGGEKRAFTLSLSAAALDILRRRAEGNEAALGAGDGGWAFPTRDMSGGITHVREPKELETYEDDRGRKRRRVCLPSPHVLRHTFASAASDAGVSFPVIQALLNHVSQHTVTERYTRPGEDALREAADRIAAFLFDKAGAVPAREGPVGRIGPVATRKATA